MVDTEAVTRATHDNGDGATAKAHSAEPQAASSRCVPWSDAGEPGPDHRVRADCVSPSSARLGRCPATGPEIPRIAASSAFGPKPVGARPAVGRCVVFGGSRDRALPAGPLSRSAARRHRPPCRHRPGARVAPSRGFERRLLVSAAPEHHHIPDPDPETHVAGASIGVHHGVVPRTDTPACPSMVQ